MTDKTKYSNISVSKETYSELKRLSRKLLPGETPLSISKTVTVLANCKINNLDNFLEKQGHQTESSGFTPPKNIINWVVKNSEKKKGEKNEWYW